VLWFSFLSFFFKSGLGQMIGVNFYRHISVRGGASSSKKPKNQTWDEDAIFLHVLFRSDYSS
jgi:hypothetical protein